MSHKKLDAANKESEQRALSQNKLKIKIFGNNNWYTHSANFVSRPGNGAYSDVSTCKESYSSVYRSCKRRTLVWKMVRNVTRIIYYCLIRSLVTERNEALQQVSTLRRWSLRVNLSYVLQDLERTNSQLTESEPPLWFTHVISCLLIFS